jgi:hypothetical protein
MTRARIVDQFSNVEETSAAEFYTRVFGHPPRTKAEKQADWEAEVERYVKAILRGCELDSYGNPAVAEAKKLIALREGDCGPDPLIHLEPKRKAA